MIEMLWKRGWILTVFLAVATITACVGDGGSEKERSTRTRLTAIPFAVDKTKLDWTESAGNEKGFKIERTTDKRDENWIEVAKVGADVTSYIDESDKYHGTVYYYRVRPFGGAKEDKCSNVEAVKIAPRGMAAIPAGCFEMGDSFDEGARDEVPVRKVCLPAFYMDVHEVTNAEFSECVKDGDCESYGVCDGDSEYYGNQEYDDYPVIAGVRAEAKDYCAWAGKRLPTEAEWEYAARGGLSGKRYPWGDEISCSDANYGRYDSSSPCMGFSKNATSCFRANYKKYDQSSPCRDFDGLENREHKVGSYAPNGYGLHDMAGNVREWVNDWYSANYYIGRPEPDIDPLGPEKFEEDYESVGKLYRVVRGGSWASISPLLRVSYRDSGDISLSLYQTGFRCAMDQHPLEE